MPNIESAIKRVRTSEAANAKNSSQGTMRTAIKNLIKLLKLVLIT